MKVENIPSKQELEDFRKKDLSNAPDDFPTGSAVEIVQKEVIIPDLWVVCDGTDSTPDLTEKFLMGVSSKRGSQKGSCLCLTHATCRKGVMSLLDSCHM